MEHHHLQPARGASAHAGAAATPGGTHDPGQGEGGDEGWRCLRAGASDDVALPVPHINQPPPPPSSQDNAAVFPIIESYLLPGVLPHTSNNTPLLSGQCCRLPHHRVLPAAGGRGGAHTAQCGNTGVGAVQLAVLRGVGL